MKVTTTAPSKKRATRSNGAGTPATAAINAGDALDRRALLAALTAVADGDFSVRLPGDWTGLDGKIADKFNDIVTANRLICSSPTTSRWCATSRIGWW